MQYEETADALHDYILRHIDPEPAWLHRIDRLTHLRTAYPRMCSGHLQGRLLRMLCALVGAHRVLEVGTFSGYSALSMAEAVTPDPATGAPGVVHTIEVFDEMEDFLREALALSPVGDRVQLHLGDALSVIPTLGDAPFDVAFIDADKRAYCEYYEMIVPRMRRGGLIIADNTLWGGKVATTAKPSDTQCQGLQAFNDRVAADPRVECVILPLRDGLTLIRVR